MGRVACFLPLSSQPDPRFHVIDGPAFVGPGPDPASHLVLPSSVLVLCPPLGPAREPAHWSMPIRSGPDWYVDPLLSG